VTLATPYSESMMAQLIYTQAINLCLKVQWVHAWAKSSCTSMQLVHAWGQN